jgi:hypothetical protein
MAPVSDVVVDSDVISSVLLSALKNVVAMLSYPATFGCRPSGPMYCWYALPIPV